MQQKSFIRMLAVAMAIIALLATNILAQLTTGKVEGTIRDKDTGQPLEGAQVIIEGTRLGNVTNADGYYFIINVPPGRRDITFTYTGYQKTTVGNQLILAGQTTTVDAGLSSTVVRLEGITVEGESDVLVPRDNTVSKQRITAEVIEQTPVIKLEDLMVLQAGVLYGGEDAHSRAFRIRGGRMGEEGMVVDGVLVRNYSADVFVTSRSSWRFYFEEGTQSHDATPLEFSIGSVEQVDIITGGYQAEYGNAQSGIVNIITKEGGPQYRGGVRFTSDGLNPRTADWGYNQLTANIGGPVPGISDLYFHASGEAQGMEDRSYTHADEGFWAIDQRFVDRLNDGLRNDPYFEGRTPFSLEGLQTARAFYAEKMSTPDYPVNASLFSAPNPVRLPSNWGDRSLATGKLTYSPIQRLKIIATNNWYRLQHSYPQGGAGVANGNYFRTGIIDLNHPLLGPLYDPLFEKAPWRLAGETSVYIPQAYGRRARTNNFLWGFDWDFLRAANNSGSLQFRYTRLKNVEVNSASLKTNWRRESWLGWSPHDIQFEIERWPNRDGLPTNELRMQYFPDGEKYYKENVPLETPFYMEREHLYIMYYLYLREKQHNFKADLDFQLGRYNRAKAGLQFTALNNFRFRTANQRGLREQGFWNWFVYNPRILAFYIQNRTDLGDFIFDYGIRYDQYKPRENWGITNQDIWGEHVFPMTLKEWSPRFDVSFPVTDKAQLRFSYGVFTQIPSLWMLFGGGTAGYGWNPGGLEMSHTDAFEAGMSYLLSDNMVLDCVTYYKDIIGNVSRKDFFRDYRAWKQERRIRTWINGFSNRDSGNIKGMDLTLRRRFANNFSLNLMYTLQFSRTTGSQPNTGFYSNLDQAVGEAFIEPDELNPIDGDRTHQFSAQLNYLFPQDFQAGTLAGTILKEFRAYAVFRLLSGQPSSGSSIGGIVYGTNYFRGRWFTNLDLRFTKSFRLTGKTRLDVFTEIFNALNRKNNVPYPSDYRYESYDTVTGGVDLEWSDDLTPFQKVRFNADFNADGVLTVEEAALGEIAGSMLNSTLDKKLWGIARRINLGLGISF